MNVTSFNYGVYKLDANNSKQIKRTVSIQCLTGSNPPFEWAHISRDSFRYSHLSRKCKLVCLVGRKMYFICSSLLEFVLLNSLSYWFIQLCFQVRLNNPWLKLLAASLLSASDKTWTGLLDWTPGLLDSWTRISILGFLVLAIFFEFSFIGVFSRAFPQTFSCYMLW